MGRLKSAALVILLLACMALAAACGAQPQRSSAIPLSSVLAPVASSVSQAEDGQAVDGPWLASGIYGSATAETQAAAVERAVCLTVPAGWIYTEDGTQVIKGG